MEENNINELKAEIEALKAENAALTEKATKVSKETEQYRQWWSEARSEASSLRDSLKAIGTLIAAIK